MVVSPSPAFSCWIILELFETLLKLNINGMKKSIGLLFLIMLNWNTNIQKCVFLTVSGSKLSVIQDFMNKYFVEIDRPKERVSGAAITSGFLMGKVYFTYYFTCTQALNVIFNHFSNIHVVNEFMYILIDFYLPFICRLRQFSLSLFYSTSSICSFCL